MGEWIFQRTKKISTNLNDYEEIGEFKVTVGQRKDENVFDIQNPIPEELLKKRYNSATADLHNKYDIDNLPSYSNMDFYMKIIGFGCQKFHLSEIGN